MEGPITDKEIREILNHTEKSRIATIIDEFIHDERNQEIARRKIIKNHRYEPLSEEYKLTPRQCKNIIKKARRTIYEHL